MIRWTRRFADSLGCPWLAVHVEAGSLLGDAEQGRVNAHLELSRRLGAEVVVIPTRIVGGLLRVADESNATHLIVGKPGGGLLARWWGRWWLLQLVRASGLDIHVVRVSGSDGEPAVSGKGESVMAWAPAAGSGPGLAREFGGEPGRCWGRRCWGPCSLRRRDRGLWRSFFCCRWWGWRCSWAGERCFWPPR